MAKKPTVAELQAQLAALLASQSTGNNALLPQTNAIPSVQASVHATLDVAARTAIGGALAEMWSNTDKTCSYATRVASVATQYAKGLPLAETDMELLAGQGLKPEWTDGTKKQRKSDALAVLRSYTLLDSACAGFMLKNRGRCNFHDAIALARKLATGKYTAEAAVTEVLPEVKPELTKEQKLVEKDVALRDRMQKTITAWLKSYPKDMLAVATFAQAINVELKIK